MPAARKNSQVFKTKEKTENSTTNSTSFVPNYSSTGGTLQTAKNFLQKLSSFSRFRSQTNSVNNAHQIDTSHSKTTQNSEKFQFATSPFFEMR